jgi:hypothetical protein
MLAEQALSTRCRQNVWRSVIARGVKHNILPQSIPNHESD